MLFKWVFGCRIKVLGEGKTRADLGLFECYLSGFLVVKLRFWVKKRLGQIWGCLSGFWVVKFKFWMKKRLGQIWGCLSAI